MVSSFAVLIFLRKKVVEMVVKTFLGNPLRGESSVASTRENEKVGYWRMGRREDGFGSEEGKCNTTRNGTKDCCFVKAEVGRTKLQKSETDAIDESATPC
ncbi:hypothetical protein E2542_SST16804 [Spatholobus suberectus]|nr:hypothetical protein E2542_SST16804 [Spatholobus suberectus]